MKEKENKAKHIIKCPYCGAEYLPEEIYYPDSFFGKPTDIVKNSKGEIEYYSGNSLELKEKYICDYCGKEFEVNANISFESQQDDFKEDYATTIYKNRLTLKEDDNN